MKRGSAPGAVRSPAVVFPVVGIGCSTGGLEALEEFFAHVPVGSGMAFVVIQHLSPEHVSTLPDLLRPFTRMAVTEAGDGMPVLPDCVYVIPPNRNLSLLHGKLRLVDPVAPHGIRRPIDRFLSTLAEDRREHAIGVLLSGMGSDGVFGLRAIQKKAGLTLVQEPASARADRMPKSAIEASVADIVAVPEALPGRITDYLRHLTVRAPIAAPPMPDVLSAIEFFRNAEVWDALQAQAIPAMLARHPAGKELRAWISACSTGEEAYSLAMVFRETLDRMRPAARFTLRIYATDLDSDAIDAARKGVYPATIAADVSIERLTRFFTAEEGGSYRIGKDIREMVVFAPHNVTSDPPFTKLDILTCRNLLIYLDAQLQEKLMPLFHFSLNRHGLLLLGNAEAIGKHGHLFLPLNSKARIFQRLESEFPIRTPVLPDRMLSTTPSPARIPPGEHVTNLGQLVDHLIQQTFAPAAVLVNGEGDILYISGRTGKYLEPAAGKTNMNLHAMAREGLREALTGVIRKAQKTGEPVILSGLRVVANEGAGGTPHVVNVVVQAIDKPEALRGRVVVVFKDVPTPPARRRASRSLALESHHALMQELQQAREALQVTHEAMQATVEELQSTNEELQSTNEEVTSSQEVLQSLNEELQTVNAELKSKVDNLSRVQNDMENLLNSTEIATVFLDNELKLRRFTPYATKVFKLILGDVGRPFWHVATDLDYPQLVHEAEEVLRTLVVREVTESTHDGRWYRVRIMPYRTQDNVIDGVVITFTDVTVVKRLETELRSHEARGS
jgi:two-component system CheB/CheR fusion protein